MGRPNAYRQEMANEICRRIAEGETLRQICRDELMPARSTVQIWVVEDLGGFSGQYARAREVQLDHWVDEIIEIADDSSNDWLERETKSGRKIRVLDQEAIMRARLRIDTKKWLLSKLKPEKFGDSLKLSGSLDLNHKSDEQLDARIAQLLGKAGADGALLADGLVTMQVDESRAI